MYTTRNLLLTYYPRWESLEGGLLHLQLVVLSDAQNCQKLGSSWLAVENSSLKTRFGSCIVSGRFLYRHASFKNRRTKKSVTQGHAKVQAMGYPKLAKRASSLPTAPIHFHWTHFEKAWLRLFLRVQTLPHTALVEQQCSLKCVIRLCTTPYTQTNADCEYIVLKIRHGVKTTHT